MIADSDPIVRERLAQVLAERPDLEVIGQVATAEATLAAVTRLAPHVVVVDAQLRDGTGLEVCRQIRDISPTTHCVLHAATTIARDVANDAGAAAVVLKQLRGGQLARTIETLVPPT